MEDYGAFDLDTLLNLPLDEVKKQFKEIIEETIKAMDYRDVTTANHKGDKLYITGGLSWGDSPTESFSLFDKFLSLPDRITAILLSEY